MQFCGWNSTGWFFLGIIIVITTIIVISVIAVIVVKAEETISNQTNLIDCRI